MPRDVASRNAKAVCDEGRGVGETGLGVYLDFSDAIQRLGEKTIASATAICSRCTSASRTKIRIKVPMRIYPAIHYTMGGLWVDYHLMSTIPGLFVIGEANFSDHGANRLGASALMQGLSDGYFILPYTVGDYWRRTSWKRSSESHPEFRSAVACVRQTVKQAARDQRQAHGGFVSSRNWARSFGIIAACRATAQGLEKAIEKIRELREEYWRDVKVPGSAEI